MNHPLIYLTIWTIASAGLALSQNLVYGNGAPPVIPLAVKTPYVNAWANSTMNDWPTLWDGKSVLGWTGFVRVDGNTSQWMGIPGNPKLPSANVTNVTITPTQSILTVLVQSVELTVVYLSPIDPSDMIVQSLPFSHMSVVARSTDGNQHSVQLYSDVSGEWVSGNTNNVVTWSTRTNGSALIHQMQKQTPAPMTETNDHAEDGTLYYCMPANTPGMTWQTGTDKILRNGFKNEGKLDNIQDARTRPIQPEWPMLAYSVDLGQVSSQSTSPVVFSVGLVRDPVITYTGASGNESRSSYFWSEYRSIDGAIDYVTSHYNDIKAKADALDTKILGEAHNVSSAYADLVSLSLRQTMAATDITILKKEDGSYDASDVKMFLKDTGNSGRVNPVDMIYSAYPAFMYLNVSYGALLLDPLFEAQMNKSSQHGYASADLGSSYPLANGGNDDSSRFGVDNSASMIILALAHAKLSGDGILFSKYYDLLNSWARYLVENGMNLENQYPTDGPLTSSSNPGNDANLGVKAIVAVQAMSEISEAIGNGKDQQTYQDGATGMMSQWKTQTMPTGTRATNLDYRFGQDQTTGMFYNLFAERFLKTSSFDSAVYDTQTSFMRSQLSFGFKFGLPANSGSQNKTRSDWTLLTAATSTDGSVRDQLISQVRDRAFTPSSDPFAAFPMMYEVVAGKADNVGSASPAQGAMYSLLAQNLSSKTIVVPRISKKVNAGAIAGGIIGGLVGIGALVGLLVYLRRRSQRLQIQQRLASISPIEPPSRSSSLSRTLPVPYPAYVKEGGYLKDVKRSFDLKKDLSVTSSLASSSAPSSSASSVRSGTGSNTSQETVLLRSEVDRLRRDIQEIQRGYDAPPQYDAFTAV